MSQRSHQVCHGLLALLALLTVIHVAHLIPLKAGGCHLRVGYRLFVPVGGVGGHGGGGLRPLPVIHYLCHGCGYAACGRCLLMAIGIGIFRTLEVVGRPLVPAARHQCGHKVFGHRYGRGHPTFCRRLAWRQLCVALFSRLDNGR